MAQRRHRRFDRRAQARRSRRANISDTTKSGLIAGGLLLLAQALLLTIGVVSTRRALRSITTDAGGVRRV